MLVGEQGSDDPLVEVIELALERILVQSLQMHNALVHVLVQLALEEGTVGRDCLGVLSQNTVQSLHPISIILYWSMAAL